MRLLSAWEGALSSLRHLRASLGLGWSARCLPGPPLLDQALRSPRSPQH